MAQDDFYTGEGTQVRVAQLAVGSRARPATASLTPVRGLTTSDLTFSGTDTTSTTYESDGYNSGKITGAGWGFTASGNVLTDEDNRAGMDIVKSAAFNRREIWVERLLPGHTEWEGGPAGITGFGNPSPADGIVTFSFTVTGRGKPTLTPVVVTP